MSNDHVKLVNGKMPDTRKKYESCRIDRGFFAKCH